MLAKELRAALTRKRMQLDQILAEFDRGGLFGDWLPEARAAVRKLPQPTDRTTQGFRMSLLVIETLLLVQKIEARLLELEGRRDG